MALETDIKRISKVAGADLSASQYRIVTIDANGHAILANATARNVGVLQNKPISGAAASVGYFGESKVVVGAGGATAGGNASADANGAAVNSAVGQSVLGMFTSTAAAGEIGTVLIGAAGAVIAA